MNEFEIDKEYKLILNKKTNHWDYYKNGKFLRKEANDLFKYYSLNINNLDALHNSYFYLSNPGDFNDPFDCNVNLIDNHEENKFDIMTIPQRNKIDNIGIAAFSETIDNHLMWAHYTNNYNGYVLKFSGTNIDVEPIEHQLIRQTLTRVIYPDKIKKIKKEYPFAEHYVFTTKMKHWKYEKEWRVIAELGASRNRVLYYTPSSVKALYVGHRLVDTNESAYRLLLGIRNSKFPDVPVYVVYPHRTELKLNFEQVLK